MTSNLPTNGPAFADIDNDGDQDLYVTSVGTNRHYLYINDGNAHFTEQGVDRNAAIATTEVHHGFSTAFGDYDNDGFLDAFVSEWRDFDDGEVQPQSHARLLRNVGVANPGHFQDRTQESQISLEDADAFGPSNSFEGVFSFTPTFADFDRDGLPDLSTASDFNTSRLYWNNGDGTFTKAPGSGEPGASGIGTDENGMGSAVADVNGDGLLDWFVTSIYDPVNQCVVTAGCNWGASGNRLYLNNGDRTFTDATDAAGVRQGGWGWGATFFDYDNDGDQDLVMTNGVLFDISEAESFHTDSVKLWENDGTGVFTEVAVTEGVADTGSGKGILTFDYDKDGDLDLFIVNNSGHPKLYRNDSDDSNTFLRVDLQGVTSNRDGIGAFITVVLDEGGPSQTRYITGGASNFLSQSELTAHFGLGPRSEPVYRVTIDWPSGESQSFWNVTTNTTLLAVEIPEPTTATLISLGVFTLLQRLRDRYRHLN